MQAEEAYSAHLDKIRPKLPPRMQTLAGTTLHDGVVVAASRPSGSEFVVDVNAADNPWGPRGAYRLRFTGVRQVDGFDTLVGDYWLYEEVHSHAEARFEYRVLCARSDFRVVADDVDVQPVATPLKVD